MQRLVEIVNAGELDSIEQVASSELAQEARRWSGPFRESFPDFTMKLVHVIAEDDKVVAHFKCSGTHEGEWRATHPAGGRFEGSTRSTSSESRGKLSGALVVVEDNLTRGATTRHPAVDVAGRRRGTAPGRPGSDAAAMRELEEPLPRVRTLPLAAKCGCLSAWHAPGVREVT